jgi:hypothetical protein
VGRVGTMFIAGHDLSMPLASTKDKTLSLVEVAPYTTRTEARGFQARE